ncbi:MAG: hypothetical protein AB2A00_17340 [Myxococcota bacterium]
MWKSPARLWLCHFGLVLALTADALLEPPFWDAAFSIFPAALHWLRTDTTYTELLRMPPITAGGPNAHANSVATFLVALVYRLVDSPRAAVVVLHLVWRAILATGLTGTTVLASRVLGRRWGVAVMLLCLLHPLVMAQGRMIYLETLILALHVTAVLAWLRGHTLLTFVVLFLDVATKEPGAVGAVALAACTVLLPGPVVQRVARAAALLAAFPLAFSLRVLFVENVSYTPPDLLGHVALHFRTYWNAMLDVGLLSLSAAALGGLLLSRALLPRWRQALTDESQRILLVSGSICFAFHGFLLFHPLAGVTAHLIPRYHVEVMPFILLTLLGVLARVRVRWPLPVGAAGLAIFFLINQQGRLYTPPDSNDGCWAERSLDYKDLLALHQGLAARAEELPPDVTKYYSIAEHYLTSYPDMGYVTRVPQNGHFHVHAPELLSEDSRGLPDEFYAFVGFALYFQDPYLRALLRLMKDPAFTHTREVLSAGPYTADIFHFRRVRPAGP